MKLSALSRSSLTSRLALCHRNGLVPLAIVLALACGASPVARSEDPPSIDAPSVESDDSIEEIADDGVIKDRKVEPIRYGGRAERTRRQQAQIEKKERRKEEKAAAQSLPAPASSSGDFMGVLGQGGHLAFKTFGRNDSITPIEAMPFFLTNQHFFFADVRGFISNNATAGGNAGLGYRHLRDDWNSWFGGSVWLDADGTSGKSYEQVGLSFEAMVQRWELRSNIYIPISSAQALSSTASSPNIIGNQLIYSQTIQQGKALTGVDFEAGYNIPVAEPYRLRAFAGYYRFDGSASGPINGFKTRLEGVINNSVTAQVLYTNDPLFGSNFMVGCQLQFPWGARHPTSTWARETPSPFRFVERNYNVIVDHANSTSNNLVAYNPLTNAPYRIEQVSPTAGPGGNGTAANPFQTIAAAQAAGDVILVQGNSVINTPVTLASGQYFLGDGTSQRLALAGGQSIGLPGVIPGSQAPVFSNITGDAVTLASNSTVSGFKFSSVTGNAITGSGINSTTISGNVFESIDGDAIHLTNSTGTFVLNGDTINSANGSGLLLNAVAGNVNVTSLSTSQTTGPAVSITGGKAGNTYHFAGTTNIQQPKGIGFSLNNSAAKLTVDSLVVDSSSNSAAVSMKSSTGPIVISNLDLNTTHATGFQGNTLSSVSITSGAIATTNAAAMDIQNSSINVSLAQVSVNGGPFGVRLLQDVGPFSITGNGAFGSAGTIQNATTGLILNTQGIVAVKWLDLAGNGTGIQTTGTTQLTLSGLRITNSTGYAIDSLDDINVSLTNSQFSGNGAVGGGTIRGQVDNTATYTWVIQGNTIVDPNGTAIQLATESTGAGATLTATAQQNSIAGSGTGGSLINFNWNGPLTTLISTNTLVSQSANMTGIKVQDASTGVATVAEIIHVTTNNMAFNAAGGTGVLVAAAGSNSTQVDTNKITFSGTGGTGLRFNMTGTGTTYINSNIITDSAGGATGMLFDNVAALSKVQIDSNTVSLLASDPTAHRGIIFSHVTPTITLLSNFNNLVTNASTIFSIPTNTSTGDIAINSTAYP